LVLLLLVFSGYAEASCNTFNYQPGAVSFPSATITLPNNPYSGQILWTSAPTPVANPLSGTCSGSTPNGLVNRVPGAFSASAGDDTLFPTAISGLSYRILFTGNNNFTNAPSGVHVYPNQPSGTGNVSFSGNAQLQLVITDSVAFGNASPSFISGPIANWNVDGCAWIFFCGTGDVIDFSASGISFVPPACSILIDPTVVTLPTMYSSAFTGTGSTPGQTPFNVQLNCPSTAAGASLSITLATNSPVAGATGVIANTTGSGYAQNVGVQVLDRNGNPVAFGTAISAGTVTAGNVNVQLGARYYQTGTSVTAGQVKATATYTITYQ
jgi:type 1 fimbria pilin